MRLPAEPQRARPVILATLSVRVDPSAERMAIDSALEACVPLIIANLLPFRPYPTTFGLLGPEGMNLPHEEDLDAVRATAAAGGDARRQDRAAARDDQASAFSALLEVVRERDAGLLVFGPDRSGRRAGASARWPGACVARPTAWSGSPPMGRPRSVGTAARGQAATQCDTRSLYIFVRRRGRRRHMARDPKYDILFEPIQLGPKTLEEPLLPGAPLHRRGLREARLPGLSPRGQGGGRLGRGLHRVLLDPSRVRRHASGLGADLGRRRCAQPLRHVRPAARASTRSPGSSSGTAGPHAPCMESRHNPRGPSQIPSDFEVNTHPRYMDTDDIALVQKMYVDAAVRARDAGFDIVYVYGAHSYLPIQFLSPFYNKRNDEYGGSFENRARFWKECLEQVREAVGDDCAIASRFAVDTLYGPSVDRDRRGRRAIRRARRRPGRPLGPDRRRHRRVGPERRPVPLLRGEPREAVHGSGQGRRPHQQASGGRRPDHEPRHDGRDHQLGPVRHHRRRAARRSPIRSFRRRSRRAAPTTSASASAATSASPAGRSAARR